VDNGAHSPPVRQVLARVSHDFQVSTEFSRQALSRLNCR